MSDEIVRAVDRMGRVVIPKEYRDKLKVENERDSFEIKLENDTIVLRKFEPVCIFCKRLAPIVDMEGYSVCKDCIEKLVRIKDEMK